MISLLLDNCRSLLEGKIHSSVHARAAKNGDRAVKEDVSFIGKSTFPRLPFNGNQKKERSCRQLAEGIPFLIEALRQSTGKAENDFLELGDELQTIYARTTELAKQIVGAISIINADDGTGILHMLQALVSKSLANLATCRDEAARKQEILSMIAADVAGLDRYCAEAERMATYLTVIGFNVRIESAQKEEFDKLFGVIAGEIKKSSARIIEIVGRIRDDADTLCRDQSQVSGRIATDLSALGGLADKADKLVNRAFSQIEELIGLACDELGRASDHSATLTQKIGEIVMGIQLHDSMNQRIEHIVEALQDMEKMIDNEEAEDPAVLLDILNLQQAQLQNLVDEVETAHSRTQDAFEAIGSCVDHLTGSLAGFSAERDSDAGDPFGQLTKAFLQLDELLGSGTALIADIDQSAEKTAESAGKLNLNLEQIQDISFQTRLVGLNSIVKAARLGEQGQTFEVLSNQLTGMTEYSDNFVEAVERTVGSISSHIEKTRRQKILGQADDSDRDFSIGKVVEHCSRQYGQFHEMSASAGISAEAVKEDIARVRGELDFLDRLQLELAGLADQCGQLAGLLQPWAGKGQKSSEQYRQEIAARYTMKQERDIHENMKSKSATVAAASADEEAQQDDVELFFDDDEPVLEEAIPAATDGADISLATQDPDQADPLDSNVELF